MKVKSKIHSYKELTACKGLILMSMLYVIVTVVPSVFVYRLVKIGPLMLPGGMFIFPFIYILGDVIAEVYGYKIAKLVIIFCLICNFLFAVEALSVIYLPFPQGNVSIATKDIFIFKGILRGDVANMLGVCAGRFLNAYVISRWKVLVQGRIFIIRSVVSSAIGELVMLSLWVTIAFSGRLPFAQLIHLALSDYSIRLLYAFMFAYPASKLANLLKNIDKVDIYDEATSFNPFRVKTST